MEPTKVLLFEEKGEYALKNYNNDYIKDVLIRSGKKFGATLVYEFQYSDLETIGAVFDYIQKCNSKEEKFDKKILESILQK